MKKPSLSGPNVAPGLGARKRVPLSFAQERLWYVDQRNASSSVYNRLSKIHIRGALDRQLLQQSLQQVVDRHESLRMRFLDRGPVAEVLPAGPFPLETTGLTGSPEPARRERVAERIRQEAARPFDLSECPPVRSQLLQLGAEEHVLLLTVHHIVFDGWSQGVFLRELAAFYQAGHEGRKQRLPGLTVEYSDISIRQRRLFEKNELSHHVDYWRRKLAGSTPHALPIDYVAPAIASDDGASWPVEFPSELLGTLNEFNNQHRVTMFMTLLAAFQTLLYRYTGQVDVTTGVPIAGRTSKDAEGLIGLFINTLPLRLDLSGNPSFADLLSRVRRSALEAYQRQQVPLQRILEDVAKGAVGRTQLFNTLFNLQPSPQRVTAGDASFTCETIHSATAKSDLSLDLTFSSDALSGEFEYRTDLFSSSTIQRMSHSLLQILGQVIQQPTLQLNEIPMLDASERERLIVDWNRTSRAEPVGATLHKLIEDVAAASPDVTAVEADGAKLTYTELDLSSNRLANYLVESDTAQCPVVLYAERSLDMVVAILGILKSGRCYVPLDTGTPAQRVRLIVEETGGTLITTHRRLHDAVTQVGLNPLCLDCDADRIRQLSARPTGVTVAGSDLAYIIYTSGSTGRPKGVMVEHQSAVNYARTVADTLGVSATDRVLQFASIGFDASVEEIFGALCNAATLVLREQDTVGSVPGFLQFLSSREISFISLPTAFWHELVHQMRASSLSFPSGLTTVVLGGQKATVNALDAWQEVASGTVALFNTYGPTETTVVTTVSQWDRECLRAEERPREFPIGRPIPNSQVYVLDEMLRPVPVGVPGELYIAGLGVARGYFKQPELTAEFFVRCPFAAGGTERMYRSGDRVRWRHDGQLEFLGRVDDQVKVRGFRVEPQEISANIEAHPSVDQCVVVACQDTDQEVTLLAYVVSAPAIAPRASELNATVRERLPEFMVPSAFVFVDALPLNANGKVDLAALPQPEKRACEQVTRDLPRNELEEQIAEIWQEVLGLPVVGIHERFFDIGGHSIKAMQMNTRLSDCYGVDIPLRVIFQKPTVAELSIEVEQRRVPTAKTQKPSILDISRRRKRSA